MWAERTGTEIVQGAEGGDPSALVFDAVPAGGRSGDRPGAGRHRRAPPHQGDPGRGKPRRSAGWPTAHPGNVTEVLLVLDATTGQEQRPRPASSPRRST